MDMKKMYGILQRAQNMYGYKNQMSVVAEECCELGKEASKYMRYPDHATASTELREKLLEESADMVICLNHIYMMFGITPEEQAKVIDSKLDRLQRWLDSSDDFYQTTQDRTLTPPVVEDVKRGDRIEPEEV